MLAADKLQLQSAFKQQATALKEKEFQLHHSNLMTVGTQAAVLASLDVTMFIEFQPPHDSEWGMVGYSHLIPRVLKFFYYCLITTAFCCNLLVVAQTTMLSVLGTGLALRGPDGSMITATDGLYCERKPIYLAFGVGLATTIASVLVVVWLILSPEAALICMSITCFTCMRLYKSYLRIQETFEFDESETVDFSDIFNSGPAAITISSPPSLAGTATPRRQDDKRKKNDGEVVIPLNKLHNRAASHTNNNHRSYNGHHQSRQRRTAGNPRQNQYTHASSSYADSDDAIESSLDGEDYEMSSRASSHKPGARRSVSPLMTV